MNKSVTIADYNGYPTERISWLKKNDFTLLMPCQHQDNLGMTGVGLYI